MRQQKRMASTWDSPSMREMGTEVTGRCGAHLRCIFSLIGSPTHYATVFNMLGASAVGKSTGSLVPYRVRKHCLSPMVYCIIAWDHEALIASRTKGAIDEVINSVGAFLLRRIECQRKILAATVFTAYWTSESDSTLDDDDGNGDYSTETREQQWFQARVANEALPSNLSSVQGVLARHCHASLSS